MMLVPLGDTYYVKFTTRSFSTGAPTTLSGTPAVSVYEENNLTQITAGITLTADYDSVTGLNDIAIVATGANGYEVGKYYSVVITTGTVGGVSVVGEVVGHFRVMPAEDAGAGIPDVNVTHWLDSAAATPTTAGVPEVDITHIAGSAVDTTAAQFGVNVVQISGDAVAADNAEAFFDGTGYAGTNNVIPSVTTVTGNVNGSVGSVTGAVGSVTGNVGGNVAGSVGSVTGAINTAAGTITTLDGLDTAQDAQHAQTQSDIAALNDPTAASIADAVWDEAKSGHTTAGTFGTAFNLQLEGTASGTPTTTTMASDIGVTVDDQFKGRTIIFDEDTTTAALRNQATDITACTAATNTLTFTALTTAPSSGDKFHII